LKKSEKNLTAKARKGRKGFAGKIPLLPLPRPLSTREGQGVR